MIIQSAKRVVGMSRKESHALKKELFVMSRTRSGKVMGTPLTTKQRNLLQAVSNDILATYLEERK